MMGQAEAQITPDRNAPAGQRPSVSAAPNGVPLANIAAPNKRGLSHNKYRDFNIGEPGLILNNHDARAGVSKLGGIVPGNANLRRSGPASVILNEVTGGGGSALSGPAEVFGRRAEVVIANPNGITCNGCGFINTPRVTLSTGIPQIGGDGRLTGFDTRGGDVTFGAKGANLRDGAGSVDVFDVVSRRVIFSGPVAAHDIGVAAGTGRFDHDSREMKELEDIAGKPEYAIDGSELGALQADRIKIIATEKGVGVRMRGDMAAHVGQINLSADGKITMNNLSGRSGVSVRSKRGSVSAAKVTSKKTVHLKAARGIAAQSLGADGDINADAGSGHISAAGDIAGGGAVSLAAGGKITAGRLAAGGDLSANAGEGVAAQVIAADKAADIHAKQGDISASSGMQAGGDLHLTADGGSVAAGEIASLGSLNVKAGGDLNVGGNAIAQGDFTAQAGRNIRAVSGQLGAHGNLSAQAGENIAAQAIVADKAADIQANQGDISASSGLQAGGALRLTADSGSIRAGEIASLGNLTAKAGGDLNVGGNAIAQGDFTAQAGRDIRAANGQLGAHGNLSAQAGENIAAQSIIADKAAKLHANHGDISAAGGIKSGGGDLRLTADAGSVTAGEIASLGSLNVQAGQDLSVGGNAVARGDFTAQAGRSIRAVSGQLGAHGNLSAQSGENIAAQSIIADKAAKLHAAQGDIRAAGGIKSGGGDLRLTADAGSVNAGELISFGDIWAQAGGGLNIGGNAIAQGDLTAQAARVSAGGAFVSGMDIEATRHSASGALVTRGSGRLSVSSIGGAAAGSLISGGAMNIDAGGGIRYANLVSCNSAYLRARSGDISFQNRTAAAGDISLTASALDLSDNRARIQTGGTVSLNADAVNLSGSSLTYGGLSVSSGGALDIRNAEIAAVTEAGGTGDISLSAPVLSADENSSVLAEHNLAIDSGALDSSGQLAAGGDLSLRVKGDAANRASGLIYAGGNADILTGGGFANERGAVIADGNLLFAGIGGGASGSLANQSGLIQAGNALTVRTQSLTNAADATPYVTTEHEEQKYQFDKPAHYDELGEYDSDYVGKLVHDVTRNIWGAGWDRDGAGAWADRVYRVDKLYNNKEEAFSPIALPDGSHYRADNWVYKSSKAQTVRYKLNKKASMSVLTDTDAIQNKPAAQGLIQAGGDMRIEAARERLENHLAAKGLRQNARADAAAGSDVTAGGNVSARAGGSLALIGSGIDAGGIAALRAGGDVNIAAAESGYHYDVRGRSSGGALSGSSKFSRSEDSSYLASSGVSGGSGTVISAGRDAAVTASDITAGGAERQADRQASLSIAAGNNVSVTADKETSAKSRSASHSDAFSSASKKSQSYDENTVSSRLGASGDVRLSAGGSAAIKGSEALAGGDIAIAAKGDVNIAAAAERHSESRQVKKSGFSADFSHSGGSASLGIGVKSVSDKRASQDTVNIGSSLSAGRDISISAGHDANLTAAQLMAGRDAGIWAGSDVNITAAGNQHHEQRSHRESFAGVTATVSSGVLGMADEARSATERGIRNSSAGMIAGNATIAGMNGWGVYGKAKGYLKGKSNLGSLAVSGNVSIGGRYSGSKSSSDSYMPVGSAISAGRAAHIAAKQGNIHIAGSDIKSGDISLDAGRDITVESARECSSSRRDSRGFGGGIGLDMDGNLTGSAYADKGKDRSDSVIQHNSHITGTGDVSLASGGDANIKGAQISGKSVTADIGGGLNIESRQDSERVRRSHESASLSGGEMVNAGKAYNWGGGRIGLDENKSRYDYASVTEQSGIFAGKGGFDVKVRGNTDLKGAVIASEAAPDKKSP